MDYAVEIDMMWGNTFSSMHEAWGVADEELIEFITELNRKKTGLVDNYAAFKEAVMNNNERDIEKELVKLENRCYVTIAELIEFTYCISKALNTVEEQRRQMIPDGKD